MKQRDPEWFKARCGKVTASRISDVMATLRSGGEAASRRNYRAQLVAERLTGVPAESYSSPAMQWGVENEPLARAAYEVHGGVFTDEVGFVPHPTIENTGASPDGLVGADGLVELKCPNTATHIDYLLSNAIPTEYQLQMLWQMECTGREWCDFVSFDPRLPEELQLLVIRFRRDEGQIEVIRREVVKFLQEVQQMVANLEKLKGGRR